MSVDRFVSRRSALQGFGLAMLAPLVPAALRAQDGAASQLPLRTTGLEHMGVVVPDVAAAGRFYGRVFNPELHKEKDPPLRYYVTLGVGYLALGSRANESRTFFDHFCALVKDYEPKAMAEQLQAQGLPAGRFGVVPDPDGIGLQLLGVPGGLAKSTEPAGRIVEGEPLVKPRRLSKVVLRVSELDRSLEFYRKFFGAEASRSANAATFQVVDTQLLLETATGGARPEVDRIVIECDAFDRAKVGKALAGLGARVQDTRGETLRFTDPIGLGLELQPA